MRSSFTVSQPGLQTGNKNKFKSLLLIELPKLRWYLLLPGILFFLLNTVYATDVNGRFVILDSDSSNLSVLLQINTNTGNDGMGGATIVFKYDTTIVDLTNTPLRETNFIFHNFSGGSYSLGTITQPMKGNVWVNIDLPFNHSNQGTIVSDTSGWTDVATIYFEILDSLAGASFYWQTSSPFWGIYDEDNATLWNKGSFNNLINYPISVNESGVTPTNFKLEQNYPNPFNPSTTIEYSISEETFVNLVVYNALGEEVAVLVKEEKQAGSYKSIFDVNSMSSGIYFYRLETGEFTETKKMVLLQ